MAVILSGKPIATIRAHVGQFIWWRNAHDRFGGWGKLTRAAGRNLWVTDQGGETALFLPYLSFLAAATARTITPTWTDLRNGCIIGHVDEDDAVDSRFVPMGELSDHTHGRYWPGRKNGLWRWLFDQGLTAFVAERAWEPGQDEFIRTHLTKRFGIEWWDNGYHDLDCFQAHLGAQKALDGKGEA